MIHVFWVQNPQVQPHHFRIPVVLLIWRAVRAIFSTNFSPNFSLLIFSPATQSVCQQLHSHTVCPSRFILLVVNLPHSGLLFCTLSTNQSSLRRTFLFLLVFALTTTIITTSPLPLRFSLKTTLLSAAAGFFTSAKFWPSQTLIVGFQEQNTALSDKAVSFQQPACSTESPSSEYQATNEPTAPSHRASNTNRGSC